MALARSLTHIGEAIFSMSERQSRIEDLLRKILIKEYPKSPEFPKIEFPKVQKVKVENQPEFPAFPEIPKPNLDEFINHFNRRNDETNRLLAEILLKLNEVPKEEKVGLFGSITSKIMTRREMGKLFKRETPSGVIDGSNKDFTLSKKPFGEFLILVLNDRPQTRTLDYTISGNIISYVSAPRTGSRHEAQFF